MLLSSEHDLLALAKFFVSWSLDSGDDWLLFAATLNELY